MLVGCRRGNIRVDSLETLVVQPTPSSAWVTPRLGDALTAGAFIASFLLV
jgi:hypothetical protein